MFSDHNETSPSNTAVSAPSVACSMLAVQQQKRLWRQFVDVSAARRGCHTMKHAVWIDLEYWQPMSEGLRYRDLADTVCGRFGRHCFLLYLVTRQSNASVFCLH